MAMRRKQDKIKKAKYTTVAQDVREMAKDIGSAVSWMTDKGAGMMKAREERLKAADIAEDSCKPGHGFNQQITGAELLA